jgi:hypothetical protein
MKYPLLVSEKVNLYPYDPLYLSPQPELSGYAEVGYADSDWRLTLFYDAYNFGVSPVVPLTSGGYYTGDAARQPKSVTDRWGLRFSYYY